MMQTVKGLNAELKDARRSSQGDQGRQSRTSKRLTRLKAQVGLGTHESVPQRSAPESTGAAFYQHRAVSIRHVAGVIKGRGLELVAKAIEKSGRCGSKPLARQPARLRSAG